MRVNVYAEEMTDRIEIIGKQIEAHTFTGLRIYLELPATVDGKQFKGPFMHRPGDDDSSAVTFWGKRDLRGVLRSALDALEDHYEKVKAEKAATETAETTEEPQEPDCWSADGETFHDDLSTVLDQLEPGDVIHEGVKDTVTLEALINIDNLLEDMHCAAGDFAGQAAEDWPHLSRQEERELKQLLVDWFARKDPVHFYGVGEIKTRTLTPEDFE